jgi:hypothetical protein
VWKSITSKFLVRKKTDNGPMVPVIFSSKITGPTILFQPRPRTSLAVDIVFVMHTTTTRNLSRRTMGKLSLFFLTNTLDVIDFQTFASKRTEPTILFRPLLDEHENAKKENLWNREPGCIYTFEYANSESSSLFFYNPSREKVV